MKKTGFATLAVASLTTFCASSAQAAPLDAASTRSSKGMPRWDVMSDTWVATDVLGRTLPTNAQVGAPRKNKTVAMFYFLWMGQHGLDGPFDITKILAQDPNATQKPDSPLWGPMSKFHHWGEPAFGYYVSTDEWVIRRHAQMLSDADVDVIIFDTTNNFRYTEPYRALCRVFARVRSEGGRTPQIAFLAPFGNPSPVVLPLYEEFYSKGEYSDLWFRWNGKPMIMADPRRLGPASLNGQGNEPSRLVAGSTQGQIFTAKEPFRFIGAVIPTWGTRNAASTFSLYEGGIAGRLIKRQRFTNIADNGSVTMQLDSTLPAGKYYLEQSEPSEQVGWWSHASDNLPDSQAVLNAELQNFDRSLSLSQKSTSEVLDFFTFRKPQASYFQGPTGNNQWPWMEVFPQKIYPSDTDPKEVMAVSVAQNAVNGKLGALSNPRANGRSAVSNVQPPPARQDYSGRNFQQQWNRALEVDPTALFVTGWNEWIAMRFGAKDNGFEGRGPVTFVDLFNREYSRDIEPMQGGHGDAFYYQFIANVRRYKGARALPKASGVKSIAINGTFSQWNSVAPEYRDHRFDTEHRDTAGWGNAGRYVNKTGRNDFVRSKVARDATNIYFYVQTREPISRASTGDWMRLLIDSKGDGKGAFLGCNLSINRTRVRSGIANVESIPRSGNRVSYRKIGEVTYRIVGNEMMISVPRRVLPQNGTNVSFNFKWIDNVDAESDTANLYRNGDTAPSGRFAYRYMTAPQTRRAALPIPAMP